MQKPYKSLKLFDNPYLERLSHVHPLTPLILWTPVVVFLLWHSIVVLQMNPYVVSVLGFSAVLLWTLVEYVLHRFVFHFEGESQMAQRAYYLIHGIHHDDPQDPTRLVMPPVVSVVLGLIFFSVFRFLMGPDWAEPFFAFFLVGYLCYDYVHFAVHHFTPRTRLGKYLKHSHMMHHYVSVHSRWGVSSPLWDYVFGTLEEVKDPEQAI